MVRRSLRARQIKQRRYPLSGQWSGLVRSQPTISSIFRATPKTRCASFTLGPEPAKSDYLCRPIWSLIHSPAWRHGSGVFPSSSSAGSVRRAQRESSPDRALSSFEAAKTAAEGRAVCTVHRSAIRIDSIGSTMTNVSGHDAKPAKTLEVSDVITRSQADIPTLVAILDQAMSRLRSIDPDEAQWAAATPCAGWSVADIYAHIVDLEMTMAGEPVSTFEPDWASLGHVSGEFQRLTERGVAERRGRTRDQVLTEFDAIHTRRQQQLVAGEQDPEAQIVGPFGAPFALDRVLRMRILDCWVHEQDIRTALGKPGGWGTPAAWITAGSMVGGLGFVLAKRVGSPPDITAQVVVSGPGVRFTATVAVGADNRGHLVPMRSDPTASLKMSWPTFFSLSAGREAANESHEGADEQDRIQTSGDTKLADAFVANLSVLP